MRPHSGKLAAFSVVQRLSILTTLPPAYADGEVSAELRSDGWTVLARPYNFSVCAVRSVQCMYVHLIGLVLDCQQS